MLYHLYYFSATGNTAHSAAMIKEALSSRGHTVRVVPLSDGTKPLTERPDRLVLAYPTYSWRPPALVSRFIARLPRGNGMEAAVFTADGGDSHASIDAAERALRRRGYRTIVKAAAHYPNDWAEMIPPPVGEAREAAVSRGIAGTERFVRGLLEGTPILRERSGPEFLLNVVGLLFAAFGRHFLGKLFVADDDCTACGLCARNCPVGAIAMGEGPNARPRWKYRCEACTRCMNLCPTKAINTSPLRGAALLLGVALFLVLGFSAYGAVALDLHRSIQGAAGVVMDFVAGIAIVAASHLLALTVFDSLVLRPLLAIPALRRLAQKSFTKTFARYRFEGFKPPTGDRRPEAAD